MAALEHPHCTSALPAYLSKKADPIVGRNTKAPADFVAATSLGKQTVKPCRGLCLAERATLRGKRHREYWPTGELIDDRLLVLEASSLAVLDNMPDQVIPQKYVELPHSVTFTSAPLGTMTMRKPNCCR